MALVVFTGGARSGKSSAAQELARVRALDGVDVTVAVFGRESVDGEFAQRIAAHREARPSSWKTLELAHTADLESACSGVGLLLVDCMGTLLGLAMEEEFTRLEDAGSLGEASADRLPDGFEDSLPARVRPLVEWLRTREGDTIIVTNEVGDGVVPLWASGRLFRDELGRVNRTLVNSADAAYLCVCGRLVDLLKQPASVRWPED